MLQDITLRMEELEREKKKTKTDKETNEKVAAIRDAAMTGMSPKLAKNGINCLIDYIICLCLRISLFADTPPPKKQEKVPKKCREDRLFDLMEEEIAVKKRQQDLEEAKVKIEQEKWKVEQERWKLEKEEKLKFLELLSKK